jgi:hypothetical protein
VVPSDVGVAVDNAGRPFLTGDDNPNQFTSEAPRQNSDSSITRARTACRRRAPWPLSKPEVARSNNSHNSLWYAKRLFERPHRPAVRTRPFQGRDPGSIPGGDASLRSRFARRLSRRSRQAAEADSAVSYGWASQPSFQFTHTTSRRKRTLRRCRAQFLAVSRGQSPCNSR